MRTKLLIVGILALIIGISLNVFCLANDKININQMTSADWEETSIPKVGEITEQKIMENSPYDRIEEIWRIPGIGEVKQNAIERRFTTYDTCRGQIHLIALCGGILMVVVGAVIIIFVLEERKYTLQALDAFITKNKGR